MTVRVAESIESRADLARLLSERPEAATPALARALKERVEVLHRTDARAAAEIAACVGIVADRVGDLESAAMAARARGLAALAAGRQRETLAAYEEAERLHREAGDEVERARVLRSMIDPLMHLGRYDEALAAGAEARGIFEARGMSVLAAQVDTNVGNLHERRDRYAEALEAYDRALATFREAGEPRAVAIVAYNRANVLVDLFRIDEAEVAYRLARRVFARGGDRLHEAQCEYALAYVAFLRGRYTKALGLFDRVRALDRALGDERHAALCSLDEAELLLSLNAWEDARHLAERAARAFAELGMAHEAGRAALHRAVCAIHLRRPREADALLDEAARRFEDEGNAVFAGLVELYRAEAALRAGDAAEALPRALDAVRRFADRGLTAKEAYARVVAARAHESVGRADLAAREAGRALALAERAPSASVAWRALAVLGRTADDPAVARDRLERAADLVEGLRARIRPDELLATFQRETDRLHEDLVRLDLEGPGPPDPERALERVLAWKGRVLEERLREAPGGPADDPDPGIRRERQALDAGYRRLNAIEAGGRPVSAGAPLRRAIAEREARLAELHRAREARRPDAAGPAAAEGVEAVAAALAPGEALVEYAFVGEDLHAFVLRDGRARWVPRLGHRAEIAAATDRWGFLVRRSPAPGIAGPGAGGEVDRVALERLADLVWTPLLPALGDARAVVVAPAGPLHEVPFVALPEEGRPVAERREVSRAPSGRALARARSRPPREGGRALVVGVPRPGLPGVREEAEAVAAAWPGARLLVGEAATRAAFRREAREASVLHVAAHAEFRDDAPLFSSIELADGRLTFYDLVDLRLPARLVVLSGCDTARQGRLAGEERLGLGRGLQRAGAGAIVAALWPVADAEAVAFMTAFHRRLAAGEEPRGALAGTMRSRMESGAPPSGWAAFAIEGDAR